MRRGNASGQFTVGRPDRSVVAVFVALAFASGMVRSAEAASSLSVQSEGTCPNAEQVSAALDYLLKGVGDTVGSVPSDAAMTLVLVDLGARYQVSLDGQTREYADPARDCEERARIAAVFAAITMEPPEVAARARPPAPSPASRRQMELRVAGLTDVGVKRSSQAFTAGGELRGALVGQHWGIEIGAGAEWPATLAWGAYRAQITRFPLDLGVRGVLRRAHAVGSLSAGVAVVPFTLRGEGTGLPVHDGGTRMDLGLRSSISVTFLPAARFSPFVGLHVLVSPKSYVVVVDPVGQVGSTPQVWVGATFGIAAAAR
jgi:hypothetical protein